MKKFAMVWKNNWNGHCEIMRKYDNYDIAKKEAEQLNEIENQTGVHASVYVWMDEIGGWVNDEFFNGIGKYL